MSNFPTLPGAPYLPDDPALWLDFGWRTWRTALKFYFDSPVRPINPGERTRTLSMCGLMASLEVRPAEWVLYRFEGFAHAREKIGLEKPPSGFIWSENALMRALDEGLKFAGGLSLPTVMPIRGLTDPQIRALESRWRADALSGEFLWNGAALTQAKVEKVEV
jgi:hypothetical protein